MPVPDGPMTTEIFPAGIWQVTPSSTWLPSNPLWRSSTSTMYSPFLLFISLYEGMGRFGLVPQKIWVRMALTTTIITRLIAMVLATARPMPTAPPLTW